MKLAIMKFGFTIIIFICWSTPIQSTSIQNIKSFIVSDAVNFPNLTDKLSLLSCENEVNSLDFNAAISNINKDFISSPIITCLNLEKNHIENIERGAFNKLPNLTHLFLSNNRFDRVSKLLNFGGHYNLQILIVNNAVRYDQSEVQIFGEYPNLEMLSLRQNFIYDLHFSPETPFSEALSAYTTVSTITQKIPFPKLEILDLSENNLQETNFLKLLPNSLYFLDLHNNKLESFEWNIADKLLALNLDNNNFDYISNWFKPNLSMAGLKDLLYLSVSTNRIKSIEPNAFQDNNKLVYLNLAVNDIIYLHPETFANLQYLKTLDLSQNKLENVPQISNEIGVSILYINYNNITKLMSNDFMQMPKLTTLVLGGNKINEIDVEVFANLSVLMKLDLSRNMLSFLPEGWAESLVSLEYLDLSDNQFTLLESLSLTNTLSLIKIYLPMNPLAHLNVKYFESLPQNLTIDLINKSSFAKWTPTPVPVRDYYYGY
ncbi:podocan-like isoform X1 [Temnothorax americanus]|uniref:podocan-like isoform X1 n=1 Tax=Temnothorax americanus TaxID=1964332 RepID=UPI0040697A17